MGFFGNVVDAVGGAINTTVHVITAPTETVINAAGAALGLNKPSDIFVPYSNLGASAGNTIAAATSVASAPADFLYQQALTMASAAGPVGQFIFDIGTFWNNFANQLATSAGYAFVNILKSQNPLMLAAAPLAAAIRAARQRHSVNAQPIPDDARVGLAPFFSAEVLARAKYAIGTVEITLPAFIDAGNRIFGGDYAVVVDDIIVFTGLPAFADQRWWWGHEMTHVRQFSQWGIDEFAWRYVRSFGNEIEREADKQGDIVLGGAAPLQSLRKPGVGAFGLLNASVVGEPVPSLPTEVLEFFTAQCFFPAQPYIAYFLITNTNRIIMIDPMSATWLQAGWATPPRLPGVAWSFDTPNWSWAVMPDGSIWTPTPSGQFVSVGNTVRLF